MTTTSVLVVEDDPGIATAVCDALRAARFAVEHCGDGRSAVEHVGVEVPDIVLLDLGLPDIDGFDVCQSLRRRAPDAVIVVLTARDSEIDVVVGLESGADDYLVKPVSAVELLARLRAHARRGRQASGQEESVVGSLRVDVPARRARVGDHEIPLRSKEFDLLARLAADGGRAVSRTDLMADVWDSHWHGSTKTLDVHIAAVRRLLLEAALLSGVPAPEIATLRGFGYRLEPAKGAEPVAGPAADRAAADDDH